MTLTCNDAKLSLGVYVLGAIEPADRALVDGHLATCRDCRDELAGLAGLPALLARVSTEEAVALAVSDGPPGGPGSGYEGKRRLLPPGETPEPPPELLATVLDLTAARRRRRRWRDAGIGVAAALVIAVGLFGALRLGSHSGQASTASNGLYPGVAGAWQTVTGQTGTMTAAVSYRSMGWGTQVDTVVRGIPVGTQCALYVTDSAGKRTQIAEWVTDSAEGSVWYPGSVSLPSKGITSFEVVVGATGKAIEVTT